MQKNRMMTVSNLVLIHIDMESSSSSDYAYKTGKSYSYSVSSIDSNDSLSLERLLKYMDPTSIRSLTLKNLISATKTDDVDKFAKHCKLVSDLINLATMNRGGEEIKLEEFVPKIIQPQVTFHRCDSDRMYIIHHILSNSATNILKYVIKNITSWEDVNLQISYSCSSYTYLHLCAFTMFYDDQVEEAKTTEGELQL